MSFGPAKFGGLGCRQSLRLQERSARAIQPDIEYCEDPYACVRGADTLVIVTEWAQFRALDLQRLKREMAQPVVVDLRNTYRPDDVAGGFIYESVGRRRTSQINIVEPGRSRVAPKLLRAKIR